MGSVGDTWILPIPAVGTIGPTYATQINAFLGEVQLRLSSKVPFSAVNFGSDLPMNGQNILNIGYLTLNNTATTPGASPVNRITAFGGDLWYVSPSGPVQITTGTTLNAAALGGITGDYGGASPAQFRYDSVTSRYTAFANFGTNTLAYIRALGYDIAGTGSANARLLFGGSVSRTYTLPASPASTGDRPLYIDTTGQIVVGHGAKTLVYGVSGTHVLDTTNLALSFTGSSGTPCIGVTTAGSGFAGAYGASKVIDGLIAGQQVTSVQVDITKTSTSTSTFVLRKLVQSTGVTSVLASASSTSSGSQSLVITPTAFTVTSGEVYSIAWTAYGSGSANEFWSGFRVNLNQPS